MTDLAGVPRRTRRRCAMLVILFTAGCSAWHPLPGASLAPDASERLGHAKVFLRDGTEIELERATVTSDSIIGFGGEARARLAVVRTDVIGVDALQPDAQRTLLAGGLVTVSLAFLYVATIVALMAMYGD